jgi:hypothetical protein
MTLNANKTNRCDLCAPDVRKGGQLHERLNATNAYRHEPHRHQGEDLGERRV